jgi:Hemerythrin HHE cation binding domain
VADGRTEELRTSATEETSVSSTDPIFYPIRRDSRAGLQQDIIRTRTDLVGTLEELSGRIDIADRARAGLRTGAVKAGPFVGAGLATGTAIAIARWRGRARSTNGNGGPRVGNGKRRLANGEPRVANGNGGDVAVVTDDPPRRGGAGIMTLSVLVASVAVYAIRRRGRHAGTTVAANGDPAGRMESGPAERMESGSTGPTSNDSVGATSSDSVGATSNDSAGNLRDPHHTEDMRDIGDVLTAQHRHLDNLFARVENADKPVTKRETFASLVDFMNRHERAEQEIVHPVLREIGPEGVDMWTRRMNEEDVADRALASLIAQDVEHPNFTNGLANLRSMVRAHARHEEDEEFPLLRAHVPGSRLRRMATRIRVAQIDYW